MDTRRRKETTEASEGRPASWPMTIVIAPVVIIALTFLSLSGDDGGGRGRDFGYHHEKRDSKLNN